MLGALCSATVLWFCRDAAWGLGQNRRSENSRAVDTGLSSISEHTSLLLRPDVSNLVRRQSQGFPSWETPNSSSLLQGVHSPAVKGCSQSTDVGMYLPISLGSGIMWAGLSLFLLTHPITFWTRQDTE